MTTEKSQFEHPLHKICRRHVSRTVPGVALQLGHQQNPHPAHQSIRFCRNARCGRCNWHVFIDADSRPLDSFSAWKIQHANWLTATVGILSADLVGGAACRCWQDLGAGFHHAVLGGVRQHRRDDPVLGQE